MHTDDRGHPRSRATRRGTAWVALLAAMALPPAAAAQTDYYNTDAGRPLRVEDAYPVERRAVEIQLAPLRLERASGGVYSWSVAPELAIGFLPQTQFEIGFPLAAIDGAPGRTSGLAGIEASILHNLNVETSIPALAIAGDVLLPVGGLAYDDAFASVKGIATKTFRWARFHVNGAYTFGNEPAAGSGGIEEISRWMGGLSVDRTFPLRSFLVGAEVVAEQPIHAEEDVDWSVGTGIRYQHDPRWALDAGIAKGLTGDARAWSFTVGSAYVFGLPWRSR